MFLYDINVTYMNFIRKRKMTLMNVRDVNFVNYDKIK